MYALLDHPVPEAALAARMVYFAFDPEATEAQGLLGALNDGLVPR